MTMLYSVAVKTAVSIPDAIFRAADRLAQRRKISRSELYATALAQYLESADRENVTERLDEVHGGLDNEQDTFVAEAARQTIERTGW